MTPVVTKYCPWNNSRGIWLYFDDSKNIEAKALIVIKEKR